MDVTKQWGEHQLFMYENLVKAATYFQVSLQGKPIFGWRERSIGSQVIGEQANYWLRVVSENPYWVQQDWWEGNEIADEIQGITKPKVLKTWEWDGGERRFRAELMTLAEAKVCSPTPELRTHLELPISWWADLRKSLDTLSTWHTDRIKTEQDKVTRRFLVFYGDEVDATVTHWTTAHGDFHWANLMAPKLSILDWEGWGKAPAGIDAASLYCFSLLVPEVADQVYRTFSDILDSSSGKLAQLYVITRLLRRMDRGDFIDLAGPLHRHAKTLT